MLHLIHHGFKKPTKEAENLKKELEKRGVKVYSELSDGYKRVDLALPRARINVEVDGIQHLINPKQIVADLARGHYSSKLGYDTMHIPNEMIRLHLKDIADGLAEASKIREQKLHIHLANDTTKFVLHGGFTTKENDLNRSFFREIIKDVPREATVLLVYFARQKEEYETLQRQDEKSFTDAAGNKSLKFAVASEENFADQIDQSDVIYLRGGDTEKLMTVVEKLQDFSIRIKDKTVVGSSAGAYLLATYYYSNHEARVLEGLGILPIRIICHYQSSELKTDGDPVKLLDDYPKELELVKLKDCESKTILIS